MTVHSKCDLFPQEPGMNNHHGSAPQISVTESTPDSNRKLLSIPASQLQVPSQHDCSNSRKVCYIVYVIMVGAIIIVFLC